MTTEIAVVNRLGVALATDSAVTISGGGGMKVFDTADKLFELSEVHPVGIMINGNMDFVGLPWEILIKAFRVEKGAKALGNMEAWAKGFLKFIESHKGVTTDAVDQQIRRTADYEARAIQSRVQDTLFKSRVADDKPPNQEEFMETLGEEIIEATSERIEEYKRSPVADSLRGVKPKTAVEQYGATIREVMLERFLPYELSDKEVSGLTELVALALIAGLPTESGTGIIIAGYGDGDIFPSLVAYDIEGVVLDKVKYTKAKAQDIDRQRELGAVVSFAQTDVIERLLAGADQRFIRRSAEYMEELLAKVAEDFAKKFPEKEGAKDFNALREKAIDSFKKASEIGANVYRDEFSSELQKEFQHDFNLMVAMMPKQDLIDLAEALVSITAVERKASSDTATVGGPVDVALITKNEGFVWVKRKHYFDPNLNPRYLWRKFGDNRGTEAQT